MSRQHGKRRPTTSARAKQRAQEERPARRAPASAPAEDAPRAGEEHPERRRKWIAVGVASLFLYISYLAVLTAFLAAADMDERDVPAAEIAIPLTLGVGLAPVVFGSLAYISQHPRAGVAVLKALGLATLAVPATVALRDPITGMIAGFGAGAVVALRPEPRTGYRPRVWAVLGVAVYTAILIRAFPGIGLLAVPALPVTAVALADRLAERRATRLAAAGRA